VKAEIHAFGTHADALTTASTYHFVATCPDEDGVNALIFHKTFKKPDIPTFHTTSNL
jgi:hypothetical protein